MVKTGQQTDTIGQQWLKMVKNSKKRSETVKKNNNKKNSQKWSKTVGKIQKRLVRSKMVKNGQQLLKIVKNGQNRQQQ